MRRFPRIEADLLRAQRDKDAESLSIHINRRLYKDWVQPGDHGAIGSIVNELAPGWNYADASVLGQARARVELTTYDPDSPL